MVEVLDGMYIQHHSHHWFLLFRVTRDDDEVGRWLFKKMRNELLPF